MTIPDAIRCIRAATESPEPLMTAREVEALGVLLAEMERGQLKRYRLHWRDGRTEVLDGRGPGDALVGAGYTPGVVSELIDIEELTT